jgi:hypothetical protein
MADDGAAAALVLAALGINTADEGVSDEEGYRQFAGALLFVRGLRRLDQIAQLLTAPEG